MGSVNTSLDTLRIVAIRGISRSRWLATVRGVGYIRDMRIEPSPTHVPHGRPRSLRARRVVLDTARALIEEGGYPAATIEEISERSGVAKTTIYRWWPNRPALVVELLLEIASQAAPPPAGPDPMRALRTELRTVAMAANSLAGRLLASLLSESQNDPQVREALRKGLFDPRRKATAGVIRRAQEAGALRADVSPLVAVDLFFGPLFYRKFVRQEVLTQRFVGQVFEGVVAGLAPRSPRAARPGGARPGSRRRKAK